jgi:hypothetical protein
LPDGGISLSCSVDILKAARGFDSSAMDQLLSNETKSSTFCFPANTSARLKNPSLFTISARPEPKLNASYQPGLAFMTIRESTLAEGVVASLFKVRSFRCVTSKHRGLSGVVPAHQKLFKGSDTAIECDPDYTQNCDAGEREIGLLAR